MSSSPSPYALLCASKPKQIPTVTTAYDLFSATQMAPSNQTVIKQPEASDLTFITQDSSHINTSMPASQISQSPQRTHYIADIHARHNAAEKRFPSPARYN